MERFFCFGKKGFCNNFKKGVDCDFYECENCEYTDGSGGEYREVEPCTVTGILGADYDLDRLKELVELVKNIPHVCKFCAGCEMEPKDGHGCDEYDSFVFSTRRLQELAEADREGRCVVLPCKVGDVLYSAFPLCGVNKHQVRKFERNSEGDFACSALMIPLSDFGKRVFLTREEAEAALKGEKDD